MYRLTDEEEQRLYNALRAAFAIPFIDDVEDFVWESVFSYAKNIPLTDPLFSTRSKLLFDIVDSSRLQGNIGWSAKTLMWTLVPGIEFELVIQRADIIGKAAALGFESLSLDTNPDILGAALLRHWYGKVYQDARLQQVDEMRVTILLKSRDYHRFACYESDLHIYQPEELRWQWTSADKKGLQGIRRADNFVVFRWYPGQKQLFERFILPAEVPIFELEPTRLLLPDVVTLLTQALNRT